MGFDSGCPEPLLLPLKRLGRDGRRVDLESYSERNYGISVKEYMDRYGVGQKKAVKELQNSTLAIKPEEGRRKKSAYYSFKNYDIINDIQDTIGYTDGGCPYVSREEIENWIDNGSYPEWLL